MTILILMRHGESVWNKKNLFTGWVDIPLSDKGIAEAMKGGEQICNLPIDVIFTSTLMRAQMTLMIAMQHHHSGKVPVILHEGEGKLQEWGQIHSKEAAKETIPVHCAWQLNERMYGMLQGLNKVETAEKYGVEQVKLWRRSYDIAPPEGESLEMTAARAIPYFEETIVPYLRDGKHVFISAHGNSLRSIVMALEGLSREEVINLEIATGEAIVYQFKQGTFTRIDLNTLNTNS